MCKEWLDFINFWNDMKDTYFLNASIDRIDNLKGYSKKNCHWIKLSEQSKNRCICRYYEYNGIRDTIAGWERRLNFNHGTLRRRLNISKMDFNNAIKEPLFSGTHKFKK